VVLNVLCNDQADLCFLNGIKYKQTPEPVLYANANGRPPQPVQHPQGIPMSIDASGTCGPDIPSTNGTNSTTNSTDTNTCEPFETTLNLDSTGWVAIDITVPSDACERFSFTIFMDNQTMGNPVTVFPGAGTLDWIITPNQLKQGAHTVRIEVTPPDCAKSWNATLHWFLGIEATHVHEVQGNETIQVVMNNLGSLAHPFHMHGQHLYMLGYGKPRIGPFDPQRDNRTLVLNSPPRRDSFLVDSASWVVFRFVADNAGAWGFHCHIEWHFSTGLGMVWNVAPSQTPNPPNNLPEFPQSPNNGSDNSTSPNLTPVLNDTDSSAFSFYGDQSMRSHLLCISFLAILLLRWIS